MIRGDVVQLFVAQAASVHRKRPPVTVMLVVTLFLPVWFWFVFA